MNTIRHIPIRFKPRTRLAAGATERPDAPRRRAGMTLLDVVATLAIVTMLLGGMISVADGLIVDSADRQTAEVLVALDDALMQYHAATERWPDTTQPAEIDAPLARCVAVLRAHASSAARFAELPDSAVHATPGRWVTIHDGYGRDIRYVDPTDRSAEMTAWAGRFPRSPHNRPFFVSAGADGRFGDLSADDPALRRAAADDLYSFDLEATR